MGNTTMNNSDTLVPTRWQKIKQSDFIYHFKRDKVAMVSFALFLAFFLAALFAPFLSPTDPYNLMVIDIMDSEIPPSWMEEGDIRFLLGTDDQGRDILSTILYGSRL